MNALFETHQMVKRLVAAGVSDMQAETVTDVVRDARQVEFETLATKAELKAGIGDFRSELLGTKAEIAEFRSEIRAELAVIRADAQITTAKLSTAIADSRTEILRWIIGMAIAQIGLILALGRSVFGH